MNDSVPGDLIRATIFHTPAGTLASHADGGLLIRQGRIVACGDFDRVRSASPDAAVEDWRGGFVVPGFVDAHVHFPQLRIIGAMGLTLLDWLEQVALPEEARMAEAACARDTAGRFVRALASHGTTTAMVFGAHFAAATAALFDAAEMAGIRVVSGLVMSDRLLRPELHQTPDDAYRDSTTLIERYHRHGRLLYAVTPRFALSTTESMLEVCQTLMSEHADVRLQTHINENTSEIASLARLFPWADDYLAIYERYSLSTRRSVMAHNVHASDSELERLAGCGTSIAHCPASNAMLGSGSFPLRRHVAAGVRCAIGTDVGGGIGFGMLKEGLQAYLMQRLRSDGMPLDAGKLLYLITLAGAEALGLGDDVGDFSAGKAADLVYLRAAPGSVAGQTLERAGSLEQALSSLFTLAGAECVQEVRVSGDTVYRRGQDHQGA